MLSRLNTRAQYAGTGIGLATVRQIVEYHRGVLTVDSREGEGTTFRVYLPLNTTAEHNRRTQPLTRVGFGRTGTVGFVEMSVLCRLAALKPVWL